MQQALDYADALDVPFMFSSNGDGSCRVLLVMATGTGNNLLDVPRKIDASYSINPRKPYQAPNDKCYEVVLLATPPGAGHELLLLQPHRRAEHPPCAHCTGTAC